MEDLLLPADARRFLVLVAGTASPAPRPLTALLARGALGPHVRVVGVCAVADAARELRRDEIPVAAGGDGTANLVARALRLAGAPPLLGILPLGTGNAFAHALGIARLSRALAALRTGGPRALDVMVTSHPTAALALATLSAGFEGRFLARYAALRAGGRLQAGLRALRAPRPHGDLVELRVAGARLGPDTGRIFNAGLYNIPCYAGGHTVWPDAKPDDGEAEAVVCRTPAEYWRTIAFGLRTAAGGRMGGRRFCRWERAELECTGPIQFDGEWAAGGSLEVRLEARALHVLVPTAPAERGFRSDPAPATAAPPPS